MLLVCLSHQDELDISYNAVVRLGYHNEKIAWLRYGNIGGKFLSQKHYDKLPSLGTEPRVINFAVVICALKII